MIETATNKVINEQQSSIIYIFIYINYIYIFLYLIYQSTFRSQCIYYSPNLT